VRSLKYITVSVAALGLVTAGCGGASSGKPAKSVTSRADSAKTRPESRSVAGSTQLHAGQRGLLLNIGNIGRFTAKCDRAGRPSVTFTAAFLLPTASITVTMGARVIRRTLDPGHRLRSPSGTGLQTWQVAPFASAEVRITTIWISLGQSPVRVKRSDCGFSAQALTTPQSP
jgi:hypothetical protein